MMLSILSYIRVERKKKQNSEYWAGRLKGKKETMEDDLEDGVSEDEKKVVGFMFFSFG